MKNTIRLLLFFLVLTTFNLQGQDKKTLKKEKQSSELGDQFFKKYEYVYAAREYEKALSINPENAYVLYQLGECYRLFFNYEKAEEYYKKAVDKGYHLYPLAKYWYASMLKHNGKYFLASENFKHFIKEHKAKDIEAEAYIAKAKVELKGCEQAIHEAKKPQRDYKFELLPAPVNSSHSEYAPIFYQNDSSLIVTSAREGSEGDNKSGALGGEFTDSYRFTFKDTSWVKLDDKDQFSIVNSKFNESSGSFNKDKTKFYFTRCNEKVDVKNHDKGIDVDNFEDYNCAIYVSTLKNGKWSKPLKLNEKINLKGQWNAQPSITPNADTLFFVSKRSGGLGMHDIWYSTCASDENWSDPINLGPNVNTPYIDMSPSYYAKEKTLFFASNGHEGFGGLDIFKAQGFNFKNVTNVGHPFNSNRDDFYFTLGDVKGLLSSNREGGLGNDDIYRFNIKGEDPLITIVKKDSSEKSKSVSIEGKIFADGDNKPVEDVEILLLDDKNKVLKKTVTDETGKFKYDNLPSDKNYKVAVAEKTNKNLTKDVDYVIGDVDVKSSKNAATKILYENIFFDFDKYELRPEARKVLDDLAAFYHKHPHVQIEMNANTDDFGSDEYNVKLSLNRGKTSLNYLIAKGVKKTGLVINAQGEGKPLATNTNLIGRQLNRRVEFYIVGGPEESSSSHYMTYIVEPKTDINKIATMFKMSAHELKTLNNLQSEKLIAYKPLRVKKTSKTDILAPVTVKLAESGSIEKTVDQSEEFYTVREQNTLTSIAKEYGMTVEELKKLNDLEGNHIIVGQKLKVKRESKP